MRSCHPIPDSDLLKSSQQKTREMNEIEFYTCVAAQASAVSTNNIHYYLTMMIHSENNNGNFHWYLMKSKEKAGF